MKKLFAAAMLVSAVGLVAGCQDEPEDKMDRAQESG